MYELSQLRISPHIPHRFPNPVLFFICYCHELWITTRHIKVVIYLFKCDFHELRLLKEHIGFFCDLLLVKRIETQNEHL